MTATIMRADAAALPLADGSVDLVVTSPPYFGLRSYTDGGQHMAGQIGDETTLGAYLDELIRCTREWTRVIKPGGSLFVNLGDKYNTYSGNRSAGRTSLQGSTDRTRPWKPSGSGLDAVGFPAKSLIGIPWRYALRCIDELGLILRAEIVWCLSGGARVYARTSTGDRPIMLRDLARSYRAEDVQLWNGERWTQVLGWSRAPDDDGALEFELRTGERIGCTPGHRWPTSRGVIRADEIRVGDVIATTRLPEPEAPRSPALLPDEDIGWLVGLYVAEGSRSATTVQLAGHVRETARYARLCRIAAALDGSCNRYQTSENGETINLHGSVIVGVLERYVSEGTAKTKRLRHAAWQRSDRFLSAVVDGYLSGDGHYDAKNDRWRLGFTANDEWAADLRTLAARVGAVCRLRRADHKGFGGTFPGWRGEWRWTRSGHWNAKADGEVVAIRRSRARDFYDLGVGDDPHLFALASGVLTHNSKPNGLPESVTDRVRRSHEQVFHLVKQPRYYTAVDEVREAHTMRPQRRPGGRPEDSTPRIGQPRQSWSTAARDVIGVDGHPLGKLPGSVWTIPTSPLTVPAELGIDHFAAYPPELVRRIVLGWSPREVCTACGEGRRPVVVRERPTRDRERATLDAEGRTRRLGVTSGLTTNAHSGEYPPAGIVGYACACPDTSTPATPGVVLDPFGGTGTTALVASVYGRVGISVDLSADYCRLARWRTTDPGERARALNVPKPPPVPETQLGLFEGLA